ncbi:SRPBCC family protein [Nocardia sp. NPDC101769]|uniref:SRPBCC family protein n=1 Tax=Nocardia sp. NPDC101769 TaxID=3364333 RepID=UPI0038071922
MAVINLHTRRLPVSEAEAAALLDTLSSDDDRLWPRQDWPPMRFDRPLSIGAVGGHGLIRETVEQYQPGRWIRFRCTAPAGFDGFHELAIHTDSDGTVVLTHLIAMRLRGSARLLWPLVVRWLHDACLEDILDQAERELTGTVRRPARWSPYVRLLRAVLQRNSDPTPRQPEPRPV